MEINLIFQLAILIMSVVAHEVAHGATAYYFGDPTARDLGRLTLNPIKHLDIFGSVVLPALLIISNAGFIVGWAKPVPYNPYNLNHRRLGEFCVSIAGVVVNFIIALFFSLVIRFGPEMGLSQSALDLSAYIVWINLVLMIFNLMPIPPLDGSKILLSVLPYRYEHIARSFERYGIFALIIFIIFFGQLVSLIVSWLFNILV
jgi:Zn-dependent protease